MSISEIADRYVDACAATDPVLATYIGVPGYDDKLTDLSPVGIHLRAERAKRTLQSLAETEPIDDAERIARAVMQERLQTQLAIFEADIPFADVNVIACEIQGLREVFDVMPAETAGDRDNIVARLELVPIAIKGLIETYREGYARDRLVARRQVLETAKQCETWAGPDGFFRELGQQIGNREAGATAAEAYAELAAFLRDKLAPVSREKDACGSDDYRLFARQFLGAEIDPDETYEWGWEELTRIEEEKEAEAGKLGAGRDWRQAAVDLDADPRRRLESTDALLAWMQDLADASVDLLDGSHFEIPDPVRTMKCAIAPPGGNAGAYYIPPTEDFSRPGTMWWAPAPDQQLFHSWRERTTVFHEGVPGHHLQCAQAVWQAEDLTRFQRLLCFVSGHGEGWALYAERLMDELGHFEDPGDRLGFLDSQALRATRVVLDIGAHLELPIPKNRFGFREGESWTAEAMRELLAARTFLEPDYVKDEVNRYLGWPAQAISYKVGERIWLRIREGWKADQGFIFDLKRFHAVGLGLGPMGLAPLSEELRRAA